MLPFDNATMVKRCASRRNAVTASGQGLSRPRPGGRQRLSPPLPHAGLIQRRRKLGAHRSGLVHHGAEHVEEQDVNVIRGDHGPIVPRRAVLARLALRASPR
jgi:hypothetical protein